MRIRNLRIAWSVTSSAVALLLMLLWERSYRRLEILEVPIGVRAVQICSVSGRIAIAHLAAYKTGIFYKNVVAGDAADWRKAGALGFAFHVDRVVTALLVPHWLPALLFATLAAAPWISRSWRFSLRTLLIATTLVAILLGLIVWLR
jgi:hypothetical protein